jgi:predicted nucleic acid-binding protein
MEPAATLSKLAQYRPFSREGLSARTVLSDLVLTATYEAGGSLDSLAACRSAFSTLWGVQVELDEIRGLSEALVAEGRLERRNGELILPDGLRAEFALRRRESEEIEAQAIEEWLAAVRAVFGPFSDTDVSDLRADLMAWLGRIVERHGVEAALLLYPETERATQFFANIEALGFDFLAERSSELMPIREQALVLFVRNASESQRTLLANLMDTAYVLTVLSIDPAASRLVQTVTTGQRVYLDTNAVYRLLNLQGPRHFLSARRLVELTQGLGFEVAVTPWTVNELKESLERARDYLLARPLPPAELADLAATATSDENFITAYWRRLREHPITVQDFYDFYAEIEAHLADHSIAVVSDAVTAVENDEAGLARELSALERALGDRYKSDPVKVHDARHRLLVLRLRGASSRNFSNAGFWFLTYDSVLPRYDFYARDRQEGLPFCATSSAWFQIVRSLTLEPRTSSRHLPIFSPLLICGTEEGSALTQSRRSSHVSTYSRGEPQI